MSAQPHVPVLLEEVLKALSPDGTGSLRRVIDGTIGAGGHSAAILAAGAGMLLGLDRDEGALSLAAERLRQFAPRFQLQHRNFADMAAAAADIGWQAVDGILLDLGLSSMQLACAGRGFSFMQDGPLDMRFDRSVGEPATSWLNEADEGELTNAFFRYGEERQSGRIARAVVAARPLVTTRQLRTLVERLARPKRRSTAIHPATRIFQATRIVVNDELGALERVLPVATQLLRPGGRLAVISFHSLEDRIVKRHFRDASRDCLCPPQTILCECGHVASVRRITRKPIRPTPTEMARNPRSRSARLRVVEALA